MRGIYGTKGLDDRRSVTRIRGENRAQAVLDAGDMVVATARKLEGLRSVDTKETLLKVALDVTDEAQAKVAVNTALAHFGRIDLLVNNARYGLLGAVEEASAEEVEHLYRTTSSGCSM